MTKKEKKNRNYKKIFNYYVLYKKIKLNKSTIIKIKVM